MEITRESITFTREFMERLPMSTVTVSPGIPGALVEGEFMEKPELVFAQLNSLPPIHEMIIDQRIDNRMWTVRQPPFCVGI